MENAWLILALLVIPAGYVVFELHAFNDKLNWCEHNLSKLKSQVSAEEKKNEHFLEHYFQTGKANRRFQNGI